MLIHKPLFRTLSLSLAVAAALTACGGSDNNGLVSVVPTGTSVLVGIAYDAGANSLTVADSDGHVVRTIGIATSVTGVPAGVAFTSGSADGTGTAASFTYPYGVVRIGTDTYVADTGNNTIRKLTATGVVTTIAGTAKAIGSADGTGAAASFINPKGIATDGTNLYVSDSNNDTIRKVTLAGVVTTIAGAAGQIGQTDGTGNAARFYNPFGLAVDGGNLYVADSLSHTLRKVVIATGVVTTLAGSPTGVAGSTDASTGATSTFNGPTGVAVYGGNAYIADSQNYTIRQVNLTTGATTTLAGTAGQTGLVDATAAAARFGKIYGLCSDGQGNLYVADSGNRKIRKVVIATGAVTSLSPQF